MQSQRRLRRTEPASTSRTEPAPSRSGHASSDCISSLLSSENERCGCGEVAVQKMSWTRSNPGRRFHGCRNYGTTKRSCSHFVWIDEEAPEHYRNVMNGLLKNLNDEDATIGIPSEKEEKMKKKKNIGGYFKYTLAFILGVIFHIWWVEFHIHSEQHHDLRLPLSSS